MKMPNLSKMFAEMLAAVAASAILSAQASTFTVGGSGNNFTITRHGDTSAAETVYYRTVPLSAFPGQHYTEKGGTLVFAPGQTGTNITVSAATLSDAAYMYQSDASRAYRFEILDEGGFWITNATRDVTAMRPTTAARSSFPSPRPTHDPLRRRRRQGRYLGLQGLLRPNGARRRHLSHAL